MITVNNVSMNFSGQTLFKDVELKFVPGNCYGIISANRVSTGPIFKSLIGSPPRFTTCRPSTCSLQCVNQIVKGLSRKKRRESGMKKEISVSKKPFRPAEQVFRTL